MRHGCCPGTQSEWQGVAVNLKSGFVLACLVSFVRAEYEPTWASIDSRPVPAWYDEAKFGIFIHWGVYSVPSWAPRGEYAEWYLNNIPTAATPAKEPNPTWDFHNRTYGPNFTYADFAPMFRAELFDPGSWARLFKAAGARYVVPTSKHHDGYTMWNSPYSWQWNCVETGPHRPLLQEIAAAVRDQGLRFGTYYSLMEFANPVLRGVPASGANPGISADPATYVAHHMLPQMKELVNLVEPEVLWTDGDWEYDNSTWRATEFLAWLFNESPVNDTVVVMDRWGKDIRYHHGGVFTPEYSRDVFLDHKWEQNSGIDRHAYGYNRNSRAGDYFTEEELVWLLVRTVAYGGNLLLNVGPQHDGRIPEIEQERLHQMGRWLRVNGQAIYGSTKWRVHSEDEPVSEKASSASDSHSGRPQDQSQNFTGTPTPEAAGYARVYYTRQGPTEAYAILTAYPKPGAGGQDCNAQGFCSIQLGGCAPANPDQKGRKDRVVGGSSRVLAGDDQDGGMRHEQDGLPQNGTNNGSTKDSEDGDLAVVSLLGYVPTPGTPSGLEWRFEEGSGFRVWVPPMGAEGMTDVRPWAYVLRLMNVR